MANGNLSKVISMTNATTNSDENTDRILNNLVNLLNSTKHTKSPDYKNIMDLLLLDKSESMSEHDRLKSPLMLEPSDAVVIPEEALATASTDNKEKRKPVRLSKAQIRKQKLDKFKQTKMYDLFRNL